MDNHPWSHHPQTYRENEINHLVGLFSAGECVSLIGLSGMGKSNLLGFLAFRSTALDPKGPLAVLVDCNRVSETSEEAFFQLARTRLMAEVDLENEPGLDAMEREFESFERIVSTCMARSPRTLALLFDGFDDFAISLDRPFFNSLRALRDTYKYRLTYLLATRSPLRDLADEEKIRELDDLFIANQVWLQPLSNSDAHWTIGRFEERHQREFDRVSTEELLRLSGHHPGLLTALATAWPEGDPQNPLSWLEHPRVARECDLLWGDFPESLRTAAFDSPITDETLHSAGIAREGNLFSPVFDAYVHQLQETDLRLNPSTGELFRGGMRLDVELTAKENQLLVYLLDHPQQICEKDDIIRAVWSEDKVFEQGVRDDSLAQLVRRLRIKIEPDPSTPTFLLTVPGRGYRLDQSS